MMVTKDRPRKTYPTDLTDAPWAIVEPQILPAKQHARGGRLLQVDMREVLSSLFSLNHSGCQ
jgi:transposase